MTESTVNLILKADTNEFSASIRQAEQEFSSRFKRMGSTSKVQSNRIKDNFNSMSEGASKFTAQLKKAAKQLTIIAGAATGIGLLGKHMLEVADRTVVMADRLGISTRLLQEMRFAAAQTGASTDQLESAMGRFNKRLVAAAHSGSATTSTFSQLGISVLEADGSLRQTESVLYDVANALKGIDSQAERAALTTALFGREGAALSLLLGKGASGIAAYQKQAQELGIVIDESLLRNGEKAASQLNVLSSILKAQMVTAFVQLAPSIINFSHHVLATIPKIKEFVSKLLELKETFIYLAKVIVVEKIANFAVGLMSASKTFISASSNAAKFTLAIGFLSKALKGLGAGIAIIAAIDALTILKQHLDLKKDVRNYVQAQQSIIDSSKQFANVNRINADEFKKLSKDEQGSYQTRLKAAQHFWHARLTVEARHDSQSGSALYAAKQNRLYLENLRDIESILTKRMDLEKNHVSVINKIRDDETTNLKNNISLQLNAYDKANSHLQTLREKRKSIAKDFQAFIAEISSAPKKPKEELSVYDISSTQNEARKALKSSNIEEALSAVNQAKEVIRSLSETGNFTQSYLQSQAKITAQIADDTVQAEIEAQEKNVASIKEKITEIKAHADLLKNLTIEFDTDGAIKSTDELRNNIQERLAKSPIEIPTVVIPQNNSIDPRAEHILKPQKKARGGFILGPGTSMSDSILARLSRGEFVVRASAVKHYGLGILSKLNQKQLPKYASGGLVPPMVPSIRSAAPSTNNQIASLTLNLGGKQFDVRTQDVDVVQALTKAVAREALKSGRRL